MADTPTLLDGSGYDNRVPLDLKQIAPPSFYSDDVGAAILATNKHNNSVFLAGSKPGVDGKPLDQEDLTVMGIGVDTGTNNDMGERVYSFYKLNKPITIQFNRADDPSNGLKKGDPTPDSIKIINTLVSNISDVAPQKDPTKVPNIDVDNQGNLLTVDGNKFVPPQVNPIETTPPQPKHQPSAPAPTAPTPTPGGYSLPHKEIKEITAAAERFLQQSQSATAQAEPELPVAIATPKIMPTSEKGRSTT